MKKKMKKKNRKRDSKDPAICPYVCYLSYPLDMPKKKQPLQGKDARYCAVCILPPLPSFHATTWIPSPPRKRFAHNKRGKAQNTTKCGPRLLTSCLASSKKRPSSVAWGEFVTRLLVIGCVWGSLFCYSANPFFLFLWGGGSMSMQMELYDGQGKIRRRSKRNDNETSP